MKAKNGVKLLPLRPVMYFAYMVSYEVYREFGNSDNCVITSGADVPNYAPESTDYRD